MLIQVAELWVCWKILKKRVGICELSRCWNAVWVSSDIVACFRPAFVRESTENGCCTARLARAELKADQLVKQVLSG